MKCHECLQDNPQEARFCSHCGARLSFACHQCGAQLAATAHFCHECGRPTGAPATRPRLGSPRAYTPRHLATKIISSRAALEGERKQVTVLFADIKSSLELLADRDPEEARQLLDPALALMMDAVHRYEGAVSQILGDGIMALFGAPLAIEDHAVRACHAALQMRDAMRRYGESLRTVGTLDMQVRIGLNSGEVLVRSIGSDLNMDYTAIGQTTHLAARMEQLAPPNGICVTGATWRLVEGHVEAKSLGPVPVKGLAEPVDVYELVGPGPVRTRFQASVRRGLSRFVGRDHEMRVLDRALARAEAGRGQVVAVVGDAGLGKSRLFYEFIGSRPSDDRRVLEGVATSYAATTPFLSVIDLLRVYFRIGSRDTITDIREKVAGQLLQLDAALEDTVPPLLSLLQALPEDASFRALDAPRQRQRILDALKRVLIRESRRQTLLVVFEDLHTIDSETHAFLDALVEILPSARLLLLVNYRPQFRHDWGNKSYYTHLRIDPLPRASAEELLAVTLGDDVTLGPLKQFLLERTAGNPFFLEESVRELIETHTLVGHDGAYRLGRVTDSIRVPVTVRSVLAARIDRLPPAEKHLLQSAAVIGQNLTLALLEAIAELPATELALGIAHLQSTEFLYETGFGTEVEYAFKHALTHEVAYSSLVLEQRRMLHARLVEKIEELYAHRLPEHVERLAHHALRAEIWEKAFPYLRQAGTKAFSHSAYREAVAWFEQALVALQHLPQSREMLEQAIDLRFDLRNSLLPLGEHARYVEYLRAAEGIARSLGQPRRLGWVSAYMTAYLYLMGDQERAREAGELALEIASSVDDLRLRISTNIWLGQSYYRRGDYGVASRFFEENVERLTGELVHERFGLPQLPSVLSRTCLVWSFTELGKFREAMPWAEEGLRLAEAADHPLSCTVALAGLGALHLQRGDVENAISLLERGLELIRSWNVPLWFPRLASALGRAYALGGRSTQAMPLLEQAVERSAAMQLVGGHSLLVMSLGEACLLAGRTGDARELGRRALELAREHQERGYEAWALRLLSEVALRSEPAELDLAEQHCRDAMALAEQLGMRPLLAHTHMTAARTHEGAGRRAEAAAHVVAAISLFRDLDMRRGLTEAVADLERLR